MEGSRETLSRSRGELMALITELKSVWIMSFGDCWSGPFQLNALFPGGGISALIYDCRR